MQGSALHSRLDSESQQATQDSRQLLKAQLKLGWSSEAVKQGVAHAKKGEYDAALGCYKKVGVCSFYPCCQALSLGDHLA